MPLDLEHHRKEAKRLVRAYRSGDPRAVARAEAVLGGRAGERFGLSDAQHVVACEQGYRSWPDLKHSADATGERVVETGRRYREGEPVRVLVRKRHHTYLVSDDGQAVRLAGRPQGWLGVAERVVGEDYLNVNRRGVVFVGTVYPEQLDSLAARVGDRSLVVYEALLELDAGQGILRGAKGRNQVGRIVVTEFVSLDGVIEDPGGSENFKHSGWSFEFDRGDEGNKFKLDETLDSEALLLGRVTYEGFAAAWPSRDGEFADKFNNMPKYVVSSTLDEPEWNNTTVLEGDVVEAVSKLKREVDGNIVVHGSAQLVETLLEHDLVDELRLMIFPVALGGGKRLFGDTTDKKPLRLKESKTVGDGVAILVYESVAVDPAT